VPITASSRSRFHIAAALDKSVFINGSQAELHSDTIKLPARS
jgi:hypothetical protein